MIRIHFIDIFLRRVLVSLSLLICSHQLIAQNDTVDVRDLIKLSLEDLINLPVSSASKIGQKINEAPSIVSLIGRSQLQKYQWISLNDIAARQAGFTIGQDRFNRTIVSRGVSDLLWSKRMLVLFDGVPFSSFQSSVTDEAMALNMAKSVEMVRGPGAVLYGTQAITGVMQVNSLSYADLEGNGSAEIKVGDYGTKNISLLTGIKGKSFNTLVSFNNFTTNGNEYMSYDALLKRDSKGNFIKQRTQDERNSNHFYTKLEGKGKYDGFSLSYHLQDYRFQMGHGFLTIFPETESSSRVTRNYVMAKYVTPKESESNLKQEYVLKYDYEETEMNMQIIPAGYISQRVDKNDSTIYDSTYIGGLFEKYIVPINSLFARGQWIYFLPNKMTLLGGVEQDMVYYAGDKVHTSNVNLSGNFRPFPNNQIKDVGPLYQRIQNKPVCNTGIYGQITSGSLLGQKFTATLGARWDIYYYDYTDLKTKQTNHRFLMHLSPRAVLVYAIKEDFSLRLMYGNAFRVASPFEQFISNSIITGINQKNIKPEIINTLELSNDWTINKKINLRNTWFISEFKNQIRSFGGSFTNVIRTSQTGFESELLYHSGDMNCFANYSYVERIEEISADPLIKVSNALIWYPAHSVNAGLSQSVGKFSFGVQGHYQSEVNRRSSEKGSPKTGVNAGVNMDKLRGGREVPAWFTCDANVLYQISAKLQTRLTVNNLFDKEYTLINNLGGSSPQPFDYQQAGRRILLAVKLYF